MAMPSRPATRATPASRVMRLPRAWPIPADLWHRCDRCGDLIYAKHWESQARVCPHCGYHGRLAAAEWLALLLDPASWREDDADLMSDDPLTFVSPKESYARKLAALQASLGRCDAAVRGTGTIEGVPLALCLLEFGFMAGSMGAVVGEKLARAAECAAALRVPLLTINPSRGARMHEGIVALLQMAKVAVAFARLGAAGQPHLALLTDPCYGGVTAAHASAADVIIAEPGAHIGFAGPRVIEQTLPPPFQTAEFLFAHGMVDLVTERSALRTTLGRLLRLYAERPGPLAQQEGRWIRPS